MRCGAMRCDASVSSADEQQSINQCVNVGDVEWIVLFAVLEGGMSGLGIEH